MKITWYGHSCFELESDMGSVVFDPYADGSVPGLKLPRLTADLVLCSHTHADHGARELVTLTGREPTFTLARLDTWHDDAQGKKRGANVIHIVTADGFRVAHLGDLGHMLSPAQLQELGRLDAVMIPVGGYYTIGPETAKRLADAIGAQVTIPMHYRGAGFGYDVIGPVEEFTRLCGNVVRAEGGSVTLRRGGPKQTLLLKPVN